MTNSQLFVADFFRNFDLHRKGFICPENFYQVLEHTPRTTPFSVKRRRPSAPATAPRPSVAPGTRTCQAQTRLAEDRHGGRRAARLTAGCSWVSGWGGVGGGEGGQAISDMGCFKDMLLAEKARLGRATRTREGLGERLGRANQTSDSDERLGRVTRTSDSDE